MNDIGAEISLSYKIREALGFGKLHSLSHLDDEVRQQRVALEACAPLAHAAIAAAGGNDRLGFIGGADTSSKEIVTVTITATLGELREARRALFVANIREGAP